MRFTAQEEYGLRCLLQIARARGPSGQEALTIPEIAARERLTPAYVAKLMRVLREAGLVESTRGQKGGYRMARPPEEIALGPALAALGGRLYSTGFCERYPGVEPVCVHHVECSIRSLWAALDAVVQRALQGVTLRDLIESESAVTARVQQLLEIEALPLSLAAPKPAPGRVGTGLSAPWE